MAVDQAERSRVGEARLVVDVDAIEVVAEPALLGLGLLDVGEDLGAASARLLGRGRRLVFRRRPACGQQQGQC